MWNLTVRAAVVPKMSGLEHVWEDVNARCNPQLNLNNFTYENALLGNSVSETGALRVSIDACWVLFLM